MADLLPVGKQVGDESSVEIQFGNKRSIFMEKKVLTW